MKQRSKLSQSFFAAALCLIGMTTLTGCQTQIGGQTLPSAFYLRDDVQYFPAGPEELLPNQQRAISEYNAEQKALRQGLDLE